VPFDLGGLVLIVVGAIFLLFVLVGRAKGAIAFVAILLALFAWGQYDEHQRRHAAHKAREFVSNTCFSTAGNVQFKVFPSPPSRVLVHADSQLSPGAVNPLGAQIAASIPMPSVTFVGRFEELREADAAYVEITTIEDEIKGAGPWRLLGLKTVVSDSSGEVVAVQTDFRRQYGWCLGEEPPQSIDRFVQSVLGRPVGLAYRKDKESDKVPVLSPRGQAKSLEDGTFHESVLPRMGGGKDEIQRKFSRLPPGANCSLDEARIFEETVVCLAGSARENQLNLRDLGAVYQHSSSWLSLSTRASDFDHFDSLDIDERTPEGALLHKWHVRFQPVDVAGLGGMAIRNVAMKGRLLTADVVYGRNVAWVGQAGGNNPMKEWFEHKIEISVNLVQ